VSSVTQVTNFLTYKKHIMHIQQQHNNRFAALCPGLPEWAGTRRNTHPPTIL